MDGVDSLGVRLASEGWDLLLRGDTARAIPALERGIQRLGYRNLGNVTPALLPFATVLSGLPATRERGLRMLRFTTTYSAVEAAEAFQALARALDQAGRQEEAREAYAQVVRLWEGADGYRQPDVREAGEALVRLTAEGTGRPTEAGPPQP